MISIDGEFTESERLRFVKRVMGALQGALVAEGVADAEFKVTFKVNTKGALVIAAIIPWRKHGEWELLISREERRRRYVQADGIDEREAKRRAQLIRNG